MDNRKKTGIIFIIIGVCIPLLALPFVSGYSKDKGFIDNFYKIGIQIRGDAESNIGNKGFANLENIKGKRPKFSKLIPKRIPLRLFFVITLIFLYMGITRIAPPGREHDEEPTKKG
ncbi:MAG: hypothetical protein LBQ00_02785 [Syntrophobacterales bacterium]|nr:hypothetical protein [Syntrophobacterales bacterium]